MLCFFYVHATLPRFVCDPTHTASSSGGGSGGKNINQRARSIVTLQLRHNSTYLRKSDFSLGEKDLSTSQNADTCASWRLQRAYSVRASSRSTSTSLRPHTNSSSSSHENSRRSSTGTTEAKPRRMASTFHRTNERTTQRQMEHKTHTHTHTGGERERERERERRRDVNPGRPREHGDRAEQPLGQARETATPGTDERAEEPAANRHHRQLATNARRKHPASSTHLRYLRVGRSISRPRKQLQCRSPRWSRWYPRNHLATRSRVQISARVGLSHFRTW